MVALGNIFNVADDKCNDAPHQETAQKSQRSALPVSSSPACECVCAGVFCCYTTRRVETTKGAPDLFLVVTYRAPIPLHRLPCSGFTTRTATFASLKVASQFHHHQKCSSLRMWSNGYYLLLLLMTVVSFLLCSGGHELILTLLSITTPAMVH